MPQSITEFLATEWLGNTMQSYLMFLALFAGLSLASFLVKYPILGWLKHRAERTDTDADDFVIEQIRKNFMPVLYFATLFFSFQTLKMTENFVAGLNMAGTAVLVFFAMRLSSSLIKFFLMRKWQKDGEATGKSAQVRGLIPAINIFIWGLGLLLLLDNAGLDLSTLVAGLGIGGVAVALAAQVVLKDLFSYISILMDKPFEVGDMIHLADFQGTVEKIGIKTTRLRSVSGEELIVSNSDLTDSRVRNFKRMQERRAAFTFGLEYTTQAELLAQVPALVQSLVESREGVRFDRAHLWKLGTSGLDFEVVYYLSTPDYKVYMDTQQAINLDILTRFAALGLRFAYPTQSIVLKKD